MPERPHSGEVTAVCRSARRLGGVKPPGYAMTLPPAANTFTMRTGMSLLQPVHELFAAAWARHRGGDAPGHS